jgi:hypothetical protein
MSISASVFLPYNFSVLVLSLILFILPFLISFHSLFGARSIPGAEVSPEAELEAFRYTRGVRVARLTHTAPDFMARPA